MLKDGESDSENLVKVQINDSLVYEVVVWTCPICATDTDGDWGKTREVDVLGEVWKMFDTCEESLSNYRGSDWVWPDGVYWFWESYNRLWSLDETFVSALFIGVVRLGDTWVGVALLKDESKLYLSKDNIKFVVFDDCPS